jgi:hypothetical protein
MFRKIRQKQHQINNQTRYQLKTVYQPEPPANFVLRSDPSFAGLRRWI